TWLPLSARQEARRKEDAAGSARSGAFSIAPTGTEGIRKRRRPFSGGARETPRHLGPENDPGQKDYTAIRGPITGDASQVLRRCVGEPVHRGGEARAPHADDHIGGVPPHSYGPIRQGEDHGSRPPEPALPASP